MKTWSVMLGLVACGDNGQTLCPVEVFPGVYGESPASIPDNCLGPMRFAARDTLTITPTQNELDRYFDRWSRIAAAEPILRNRGPQVYRKGGSSLVAEITTTNRTVIEAFNGSDIMIDVPATNDMVFDQIIRELVRPQLYRWNAEKPDGSMLVEIASSAEFNQELLNERLLATSSHLPDPFVAYQDDGHWSWLDTDQPSGTDEATAQVDFSFGWGDCFVSCTGMHDLRAVVGPHGPATVYDMGGDPLPPELVLAPGTLPP